MNGSQLLYKISDLQYSIRMKELEYTKALKAGDQLNMDLNNDALAVLREDLAVKVKAFNSIPAHSFKNVSKDSKKAKWWQSFFNLKGALKK